MFLKARVILSRSLTRRSWWRPEGPAPSMTEATQKRDAYLARHNKLAALQAALLGRNLGGLTSTTPMANARLLKQYSKNSEVQS